MTQVNGKRDYKHAYKLQKASGETTDQIERQRARRAYDKAGVDREAKTSTMSSRCGLAARAPQAT